MIQRLERNGIAAEHRIDYVIGSGSHAFGYLVQAGDALFQSPLSYYTQRRLWDLAPGYERTREPDFNRPVTDECLYCHAGRPRPKPETVNRYEQPPFAEEGISCDRCHGPAEAHLERPSAANIVNPRKLPPRRRESVCEQCHLGGEARILNPGRQFGDFRPGQELEEVWSTYVPDVPPGPAGGTFKVVSHSQQLARSACARKSSGKMWCGTCHDPHEKPEPPSTYYRARCLACHGEALVGRHSKPADDCTGCHMQRRSAQDGGHTAFTDHEILRRPRTGGGSAPRGRLAAWREPAGPLAKRNLGLAYLTAGRRGQSAAQMAEGLRLLEEVRDAFPQDPAVLEGLGLAHLGQGETAEAVQWLERAIRARPQYAPYHLDLALARKQAGNLPGAEAELERAIGLDPYLEEAYFRLAAIYAEARQPAKARGILARYLKSVPGNLAALAGLEALPR